MSVNTERKKERKVEPPPFLVAIVDHFICRRGYNAGLSVRCVTTATEICVSDADFADFFYSLIGLKTHFSEFALRLILYVAQKQSKVQARMSILKGYLLNIN